MHLSTALRVGSITLGRVPMATPTPTPQPTTFDAGLEDLFDTDDGALSGRANWSLVAPSDAYTVASGRLAYTTQFGTGSPALFGSAVAPPFVARWDYDLSASATGAQAWGTTRVLFYLWYVDASNYCLARISISNQRLEILGMVGGTATTNGYFTDTAFAAGQKGVIEFHVDAAYKLRVFLTVDGSTGRWLKNATHQLNVYPYDNFDMPSYGYTGTPSGHLAVAGTTYDYTIADAVSIDAGHVTIDRARAAVARGSRTATSGTLPLTGTYQGAPTTWLYRLTDKDGVSGAWAVLDVTASAGVWSASVPIPVGYGWTVEVAVETGGLWKKAVSTKVLCGAYWQYYGQSNADGRKSVASSGQGAGYLDNGSACYVSNVSTYYPAAQFGCTEWSTYFESNCYQFARDLAGLIGVPVIIAATGQAGSAIVGLMPGTTPFDTTLTGIIGDIGTPEGFIFDQGEGDADSAGLSISEYRTRFLAIVDGMETLAGDTSVPVVQALQGRYVSATPPSGIDSAQVAAQRNQIHAIKLQLEADYPDRFPVVWHGAEEHTDAYHYTTLGYREQERREALTVARVVYGITCPDGGGPRVVSGTRSGATITLTLDMRGYDSLSGSAVASAWQVSTDDFATLLTVSSVAVSGNQIVVTLDADPGAACKVRSYYGWDYDDSSVIVGTKSGFNSAPVLMIVNPVSVS